MPKRISRIDVLGNIALIRIAPGVSAMIDAADVGLVSGRKWLMQKAVSGAFAYCRENGKKVILHRLIFGGPQQANVFHANGDRMDNRRSNLIVSEMWEE